MTEGERARFWLEGGSERLLPLVRCTALECPGVRHGFGTRWEAGPMPPSGWRGVRQAARSSQQLGALARTLGVSADALFHVRQVHGANVVAVPAGAKPGDLESIAADALITGEPGTAVAVSTADCVPVLMADARRGVVAAVHAGWRGLAQGVLEATVDRLVAEWGASLEDLVAVAGPAIGSEAYEVGAEVVAALGHLALAWSRPAPDRPPHLDLRAAAGELLRRRGVGHFAASPHCTMRDAALFYSYRREGAETGRQLNAIALLPRS
ncbi:MAG: peptidoglycan editing factor PgeF [Proteobacteria bacterium]|nr:peptidoglycan editing factor PgeF [Pseudomonadota bacterium]